MNSERLAADNLKVVPKVQNCLALDALIEVLDSGKSHLSQIDTINELFDNFVASEEYKRVILGGLEQIASGPVSRIPLFGRGSLIIFRNTSFSLLIQTTALPRGPQMAGKVSTVATLPENGLQSIVSPSGTLRMLKYRLPDDVDLSVFDPSVAPLYKDEIILHHHSKCHHYHRGDIYQSEPNGTVCLVRLCENSTTDYQWTFDKDSLIPLFSSVTLPSVGRFETLIDLAVRFSGEHVAEEEAIALLESMLSHPLHFIRWKAVQGLGELDGAAALRALQRLVDDPHPHIRAAAEAACTELAPLNA